jgi:hypothetical protein
MSFTEKDCKYWKKGMCVLAVHPDEKGNTGSDYFDNVHPCDVMVPCGSDEGSLKKSSVKRELKKYRKTGRVDSYTLIYILKERNEVFR